MIQDEVEERDTTWWLNVHSCFFLYSQDVRGKETVWLDVEVESRSTTQL